MSKNLQEQLKAFVEHIAQLEKVDEFDEDGFSKQFKELRSLGMSHREENKFPAEEGRKDENIKKNRYKDILPFDATKVTLKAKPDEPGSDYINANFVEGANGKKAYIASQGPLPHTVQDFWRMLWEYNIEVVVMVCQEVESGKAKCERYWAKNVKEEKQFGDLHVKLVEEDRVSMYFFRRKLTVWETNKEDKPKTLTHFHYTGWMDHDIPHDFGDIIDLVKDMRKHQTNEDIPVVIHCSAGCGRTGTICAIDYVWNLLKEGLMTNDFSLYDIILKMRSQRQSMVQTPEQFKVVHLAVKEMFVNHIKETFEQHNYENVELDSSKRTSQTGDKGTVVKEANLVAATGKVIQQGKDDAISKQKLTQGSHPKSASPNNNPQKPTRNPQKPTNINLTSVTSAKKTEGPLGKKPPTPNKPTLSPKPVTDNQSKSLTLHHQLPVQGNLAASKFSDRRGNLQAQNSYENMEIQDVATPKKGQFVTKITVGSDSTGVQQKNTSKPTAGNYQNSPVFNNSEIGNSSGPQKGKKAAPLIPEVEDGVSANHAPKVQKGLAVKKKEQNLPPVGNTPGENSGEYSVVSKTANSQAAPPAKRLARAPAALPPKVASASGPYEDVASGASKEYSYAEPNATDKWALQRLARQFDQKATQNTTRPPNPYEEIDVASDTVSSKLRISGGGGGDGAYSSVDDLDMDDGEPCVPVPPKTPLAYIDLEDDETEEKNAKNRPKALLGKLFQRGGKGEVDLTKAGAAHAKDSDNVVLMNNKHIGGYKKRVDRPKGKRALPRGWSRESSL